MEITLCLIVKDEEKNLSVCLKSFESFVDKIVIVDTGSCDKTKEIALSYGADVYDFDWIDDFAAARNFALSKVESEWVMMVDADDMIEYDVLNKLKDFMGNEEKTSNIFGVFLPYEISAPPSGRLVRAYKPYLWRNSFGFRYRLAIHEYLDVDKKLLKNFIRLDLPIKHRKVVDYQIESFSRNIRILKKAVKKDPLERRYYYFLGHDNHFSGNYKEAVFWYLKYIELDDVNRDELSRVYFYTGFCYRKLGDEDKAIFFYKKAIDVNSGFIEPYLQLANMYEERGVFEDAVLFYVDALKCNKIPETHIFVNPALYDGYAKKRLEGLLYKLQNKL